MKFTKEIKDKIKLKKKHTKMCQYVKIEMGCVNGCNETYDKLVFHHVNPEHKRFTIAEKYHYKWNDLIEEIKRCVVLCDDCHKKLHNHFKDKEITEDDLIKYFGIEV